MVAPDCSVRLLEGTSPIIGAFPDLTYEDRRVPLDPTETVLLYTDGVTEARDRSGAFFGESGLLSSLTSACDADISKLPDEVFDAVMAFTDGRLTDDIALLAFRHTGQTLS